MQAPFASSSTVSAIVVLGALLAPLAAQDAMAPSPKLAVLQKFVGHWEGKGTASMPGNDEATSWTATLSFQPILGGHFFQEDLEVDVGAAVPLQMRSIYGWDGELERYVGFSTGNTGEAAFGEIYMTDSSTLVVPHTGDSRGYLSVSRSVTKLVDGKLEYHAARADNAGEWHIEVQGSFTKLDQAPKTAAEASFMDMPIANELSKLAQRMAGSYELRGAMTTEPGLPETNITGTETLTPLFGGHAIRSVVEGKAEGEEHASYVGHSYVVWNAGDKCFDLVGFDNMGTVGRSPGRLVDENTLVAVWAGSRMGQPTAERSVMKLGENGVQSWTSHSMVAGHEPLKSFHVTYTRRDGR